MNATGVKSRVAEPEPES